MCPMQRSLTFLLRLLSGIAEFQPHVWILPCSDIRMCHLVFRWSSYLSGGQVMIRLTTGSKPLVLWFKTLPMYIKATLRSLSHARTRMQPTKVLTVRLSLVRGTSCERLKKCHHLAVLYSTIAYGTYNS